ncbi:hypothetical protein Q9251_13060 [Alkalihalobacillus macyae]|uniref:hypothetical protein n=1 Tax=Guptibacillus hwajinpoensis TaxID=208199 RepID=UPI00273CD048|nr:hypothetical protein [Alkalihalobacillus macyae]MDP4551802.1 hypothetical protein [Alkalihalobacillus macyae]
MRVERTGIYRNIQEKRYEYWVVESADVKVMASWISWDVPLDQIEKWKEEWMLSGIS